MSTVLDRPKSKQWAVLSCVGIASDSIYWWDFYCLFAIDERPDVAIHKI